jgi:hypothetical protein
VPTLHHPLPLNKCRRAVSDVSLQKQPCLITSVHSLRSQDNDDKDGLYMTKIDHVLGRCGPTVSRSCRDRQLKELTS